MSRAAFKGIALLALLLVGTALSLVVHSQLTSPSPAVGIVDKGEVPVSGQGIVSYTYTMTIAGGLLNLNYAQTSGPFSVQLNTVIQLTNGQYYWFNNVVLVNYLGGNEYQVTIEDYLWNLSAPDASINPSLIRGSGTVETYNGIRFYYYSYNTYTISAPFSIILESAAVTYDGYPAVFPYFELVNSNGAVVANGTFDSIFILLPAVGAHIIVGGRNPAGTGNYLSFVVGGPVSGTELQTTVSIYSWNATMGLVYYPGHGNVFYNVPGGYSTTYEALSGVSTTNGIAESFNGNMVVQTAGQTQSAFLWTVYSSLRAMGNTVYIITSPGGGDWVLSVSGPESFTENLLNYSTEFNLPDGSYTLTVTLYLDSYALYTASYSVTLPYELEVRVISPVPFFYANGQPENVNVTVSLPAPSVLKFNQTYYVSSDERYLFQGVEVNGRFYPNTTIYLSSPGFYVIVPQYVLQYYLYFPFQLNGYVNGTLTTIESGWYNAGTEIQIPAQNVTSNGVLYEVLGTSFVVNAPSYTLYYVPYYYVKVSQPVPANINGVNRTLTSGYYSAGTKIIIYRYYYLNSTTRYLINTNVSEVVVNSPVTIAVSVELQYLVTVNLPNGTITEWATRGSALPLPEIIQISKDERYMLAQNGSQVVTGPGTITPRYVKQYLVTVELPNGTNFVWANQGSTYELPLIIPINSTARYLLVSQQNYTIDSPQTLTPSYVIQYLVIINLPNGTITEWVARGSIPPVPQIIQVSGYERYFLNSTLGPVYGSETITPNYVVQYLVMIGNSEEWVTGGSKIQLNQPNSNPFVNVYWQGNISAANGQYVIVNGPLVERPVYALNILAIMLLIFSLGASGVGAYVVHSRRNEVLLTFEIPEGYTPTIKVKVDDSEITLNSRTLKVRRGSSVTIEDVVVGNTILVPATRTFTVKGPTRVEFQERKLDIAHFDPTLWKGRKIDSYEVIDVIGEGGTSYVLQVRGADGNTYAMKVMKVVPTPGNTVTVGMRNFQELYKELNNLIELSTKTDTVVKVVGGKVDFPTLMNIVKGNVELYLTSPPYLVMEYMNGGTLARLMANPDVRNSNVWEKIVVRVLYEIARALYFIHSQGYVHLDVKPQNVFFTQFPGNTGEEVYNSLINGYTQVKLGDLGSAVKVGSPVTQLTLEYCPPEQLVNPAHPSMDVYALGSMAYALLTGKYFNDVSLVRKAFSELTTPQFQNTYSDLLREITARWSSLPDDGLMGIIKKMLHPDPTQRPTAAEVASMLYPYLTG